MKNLNNVVPKIETFVFERIDANDEIDTNSIEVESINSNCP